MLFRIALTELAAWMLDQLSAQEAIRIRGCLEELARNPYRDMDERVTLVLPLERVYRDSYRCGDYAIAYEFQDDDTLLMEAIGNLFY